MLEHSDIHTTKIYAKVIDKSIAGQMNGLAANSAHRNNQLNAHRPGQCSDRLGQILGQNTVQVQEYINQCVITDKIQLVQILEQLFVQVWNRSRTKDNAAEIISDTIDLLCMLYEGPLSANELSNRLDYTSTKDLKRKMISPLIELDYITMTNPDKPTSAKQAYKLTEKGYSLFNPEES